MKKIKDIISEILKTVIETKKSPHENREEIIKKLALSGYNAATVKAVISFFFSNLRFKKHSHKSGIRLLHPSESSKLTLKAQGFLLDLFHNGMIDYSDFEDILDLIRDSDEQLDLADLLGMMEYFLGYKSGDDELEAQPASLYFN